jgi:hypothetical protein
MEDSWMTTAGPDSHQEPDELATAIAYLSGRNIPGTAREFRLRQEFFRYEWDIRVREEEGGWTVHALKPDRPEVLIQASTEGNALRIALMQALQADETR